MNYNIVDLVIDTKVKSINKTYSYLLPETFSEIAQIGKRVIVPFGKGNTISVGIIVDIRSVKLDMAEAKKYKYIISILDSESLISEELLELANWISKEFMSTKIDAIKAVFPPGDFKKIKVYYKLIANIEDKSGLDEKFCDYIVELGRNGSFEIQDLKEKFSDKTIISNIKLLREREILLRMFDVKTFFGEKNENMLHLVREDIEIGTRAKKQNEIFRYLKAHGDCLQRNILEELSVSKSVIKTMVDRGIIEIIKVPVKREFLKNTGPSYSKNILTDEQENVMNEILSSDNSTYLLHGITGSGKTEIYLQLVEIMLNEGKDAIILVPEISLTPQTVDRFVERFGNNIAVLHSKLSQGERFEQWKMIKDGKVKIVIGARSAIFAPFDNLGVIVIDEEHENTYKSSNSPRYDTIKVALKRAELNNAKLVLGSATPSINSYKLAKDGDIKLLNMNNRATGVLPEIVIADMREELKQGNRSILSRVLYSAIKEELKKGKQIILFLNRKGYSSFVSCRDCGYVVKCVHCDVSMAYYRSLNKLKCNYCGRHKSPPTTCPKCFGKKIKYFGIGTELVEDIIKKTFPKSRVVRMDINTTSTKQSHEKIYRMMINHEADILIGTQMISKGLDFANVSLVGILAADMSLNLPDYSSAERTFQLITQVSGRAGRRKERGRVILQTYNPDNYTIKCASNNDYESFITSELKFRSSFNYPPYAKLFRVLFQGKEINKLLNLSRALKENIEIKIKDSELKEYVDIIGPSPAPIEMIKSLYRVQIIIKCKLDRSEELKNILVGVYNNIVRKTKEENIKIIMEVNPNSML